MTATIYLEPSQVPPAIRSAFDAKKWRINVCERMTIPIDAGLMSGGSWNTFDAIMLETGQIVPFPGQSASPWDNGRRDIDVPLRPGFAVAERVHFCGKDMGVRLYVHPADAAPMLPGPVELTEAEKYFLEGTGFKAGYGGKSRYEHTRESVNPCWGPEAERKPFPTLAEWEAAKVSLIARGFVAKNGAITPAGRNAKSR